MTGPTTDLQWTVPAGLELTYHYSAYPGCCQYNGCGFVAVSIPKTPTPFPAEHWDRLLTRSTSPDENALPACRTCPATPEPCGSTAPTNVDVTSSYHPTLLPAAHSSLTPNTVLCVQFILRCSPLPQRFGSPPAAFSHGPPQVTLTPHPLLLPATHFAAIPRHAAFTARRDAYCRYRRYNSPSATTRSCRWTSSPTTTLTPAFSVC